MRGPNKNPRLLRAADANVTGVDIGVTDPDAAELRAETAVTRIGLDRDRAHHRDDDYHQLRASR